LERRGSSTAKKKLGSEKTHHRKKKTGTTGKKSRSEIADYHRTLPALGYESKQGGRESTWSG